ncbi:T9SS type A sorting domain-containing protein [Winogradskyella sp. PG-2]|uniref:T9SS type A sorting domain-containing protein n=1 Tax=Winogradskyella sp. PG-2 TaxID=754409 RepID=UPI0004585EA9|nr:T9SS type A sorting domain-containing protein [Winogradskyella sp. PG-2]BAO77559.1 hypothetical protein WPG_3329 [Winogradskyella sp. PG-2]
MKSIYYTFILLFSFISSSAQQLNLETALDASINETSGLLYLNNTLITHNDSSNANELYDVDTSTGAVTRTVIVNNAANGDWEDLTHDGTYIYIGDFGNYDASRTNLRVYRILITDYFANTSVTADVINFSYSNQTDFTPSPTATNFDAEGLIHFNNKLYVFSKNWLNGNTDIYELSKTPGTYSITSIDTIAAQGLISGATYNALDNSVILSGYDFNGAFLIQLSDFSSGLFSNGSVIKTTVSVPTNYSPQIEGITPISANEYYVSAEENTPDASGLYSFNVSTLSLRSSDIKSFSFYPNPAKDYITLSHKGCITKIYSITGRLVKTTNKKRVNISELTTGIYLINIEVNDSGFSVTKRLIIN